jgi:NADP-dependent 3-hydroxy acid dehydrogenase YdfG
MHFRKLTIPERLNVPAAFWCSVRYLNRRITGIDKPFCFHTMEITGKTIVVTGASQGIGFAIAKTLIEQGATVIGLARSASKLDQAVTELGNRFNAVSLDVTSFDAVQSWAESLQAPVHALINNAGIGLWKNLELTSAEEWNTVMRVNVDGVFNVTRSLLPKILATAGTKHIISISSVAGLIGNPGLTAYNASKFAIRGFSEALMKELRTQHIKVSCVYPGSVDTPFFDKINMPVSKNALRPGDVADAVSYLLKTPDHVLVDELVIRPANPNG